MDISTETLISFSRGSRELPGNPSRATLHRWRLRGVRGVKLATCLLGGRRYTSVEAWEQFSAAVTAAAEGMPTPSRTPRQREAAIAKARRELLED
jgi:hypothetical protein